MLKHKANVNARNNVRDAIDHITITNALHKTAVELIPSHNHDCVRVSQKYATHLLGGGNNGGTVSVGGEDDTELSPAPASYIQAWNKTLNAICCEPAFSTTMSKHCRCNCTSHHRPHHCCRHGKRVLQTGGDLSSSPSPPSCSPMSGMRTSTNTRVGFHPTWLSSSWSTYGSNFQILLNVENVFKPSMQSSRKVDYHKDFYR
jgi:hypothetical protein